MARKLTPHGPSSFFAPSKAIRLVALLAAYQERKEADLGPRTCAVRVVATELVVGAVDTAAGGAAAAES
jgi:hypothetical protein